MECSFCKTPHDSGLHLVHHLGGGASYACDQCVQTNPDIHKTETGVYYYFHVKGGTNDGKVLRENT